MRDAQSRGLSDLKQLDEFVGRARRILEEREPWTIFVERAGQVIEERLPLDQFDHLVDDAARRLRAALDAVRGDVTTDTLDWAVMITVLREGRDAKAPPEAIVREALAVNPDLPLDKLAAAAAAWGDTKRENPAKWRTAFALLKAAGLIAGIKSPNNLRKRWFVVSKRWHFARQNGRARWIEIGVPADDVDADAVSP